MFPRGPSKLPCFINNCMSLRRYTFSWWSCSTWQMGCCLSEPVKGKTQALIKYCSVKQSNLQKNVFEWFCHSSGVLNVWIKICMFTWVLIMWLNSGKYTIITLLLFLPMLLLIWYYYYALLFLHYSNLSHHHIKSVKWPSSG